MTAVEWLNRQIRLNSKIKENSKGEISFTIGLSKIDELFKQAEKMERQQMIEAWDNGFSNGYDLGKHDDNPKPDDAEQYYNETFKNK